MIFDVVTPTLDIGSNLTAVLIALIAAIPAIIAAWYARRASNTSTATSEHVNGRMNDLIKLKDDQIATANAATAYAQGLAATPPVVIPVVPTIPISPNHNPVEPPKGNPSV